MQKQLGWLVSAFRYRKILYYGRSLSFGPPIAAVIIALVLALPAQMGELYLEMLEEGVAIDVLRDVAALACLVLLGCLLFCWHWSISTPRIGDIYEEYPNLLFDGRLLRIRNAKAWACGMLPTIGVVLGIAMASTRLRSACTALTTAPSALDWSTKLGTACAEGKRFAGISEAETSLLFFAFMVGGSGILLHLAMRQLTREIDSRHVLYWIAAALAVIACAGPMLLPEHVTISVAWLAGPMVAILVVITSAVTIFMGLSWLSRRWRFPVIGLLLALGVAVAAIGIRGNVSTATAVPTPPREDEQFRLGESSLYRSISRSASRAVDAVQRAERDKQRTDAGRLEAQFVSWLRERRGASDKPYPVFVVAAEGGGIYAASAISLFLASLQDRCSEFAEHVFAISAVSGGAVGATVFRAELERTGENDCLSSGGAQDMTRALERVMQSDHLSPIVALLIPDILRKVFPSVGWDRSTALEWSLACAFDRAHMPRDKRIADDIGLPICNARGGSDGGLQKPFGRHWRDYSGRTRRLPALLLNATWVETGFRVAFAPDEIKLKGIGDGTLYAFTDLTDLANQGVSMVRAAVVSARFPVIAPPYTVAHPGAPKNKWNFVDGGYADNSGSTTAYEVVSALEKAAKANNAELHLIVLTDAVYAPDPQDINGSGFTDTVAPVSALLNVRAQLASRAVTQATDHFRRAERPNNLHVVHLDQSSVPLPLGWKISRTKLDVVRLMLGDPDLCRDEPPIGLADVETRIAPVYRDEQKRLRATIRANSCVKRNLVDLINGTPLAVRP